MHAFLYDTNVFVYATGSENPYQEPCRQIIQDQIDGSLAGEISLELVQEFVNVRMRLGTSRSEAVAIGRHITEVCVVHPVELPDMQRALDLLESSKLQGLDAVHAATALNRNIEFILSTDKGFDAIKGLTRIDPLDELGIARLRG